MGTHPTRPCPNADDEKALKDELDDWMYYPPPTPRPRETTTTFPWQLRFGGCPSNLGYVEKERTMATRHLAQKENASFGGPRNASQLEDFIPGLAAGFFLACALMGFNNFHLRSKSVRILQ